MRRLLKTTTIAIAAALLLTAAAHARSRAPANVRVQILKGKQPSNMVLKVSGASKRPMRVTVPWGVAYKIAWSVSHGGGLKVSTARDGMTGNMLRITTGKGSETLILDRMRRAGPNGQTGVAALRFQRGLGKHGAFHMGRTRTVKITGDLPSLITGTSGPSRRGAYPMLPVSLTADLSPKADGSLRWYYKQTRSTTSDVSAPLQPFRYNGAGSSGVTAKPATLVDAANILGR
jgi:hypothetical protein